MDLKTYIDSTLVVDDLQDLEKRYVPCPPWFISCLIVTSGTW
jgi:hypothetical protein